MSHEPTPQFLECLKLGLSLKESAETADIPYATARQWVSRGRKQTKGSDHDRYRSIVEAQGAFKRGLQASLMAAAKKGDSRAAMALLDRFEDIGVSAPESITIPRDKRKRIEWEIEIANQQRIAAEAKGSFVAARQYLQLVSELNEKLQKLNDPTPPTHEEALAILTEDVESWGDDEFQVVIRAAIKKGLLRAT